MSEIAKTLSTSLSELWDKGINTWKAENLKDLQDTIYNKAKNKLESDYVYNSPYIGLID